MTELLIRDLWLPDAVQRWDPRSELGRYIQSILHYLPPEQAMELIRRLSSTVVMESLLRLAVGGEQPTVVSRKVVTDAGVYRLVDAFHSAVSLTEFRWHGAGWGTPGESSFDTELGTEYTTEYLADNQRTAGTNTEGGGAEIFRSEVSMYFDGVIAAVTEHGLFNQQTAPGGVIWDRSVFAPRSVGIGEALYVQYELSVYAGG